MCYNLQSEHIQPALPKKPFIYIYMLENYLNSLTPLNKGNAKKVLETKFRNLAGDIYTRAEKIENLIYAGAQIKLLSEFNTISDRRKTELESELMVLRRKLTNDSYARKNPESSLNKEFQSILKILEYKTEETKVLTLVTSDNKLLTAKEITEIGLKYAKFLLANSH